MYSCGPWYVVNFRHSAKCFLPYNHYIMQVILCLSIWFSLLSVYLWTRLRQRTDPAYSTPDEFSHFGFFKVSITVDLSR